LQHIVENEIYEAAPRIACPHCAHCAALRMAYGRNKKTITCKCCGCFRSFSAVVWGDDLKLNVELEPCS